MQKRYFTLLLVALAAAVGLFCALAFAPNPPTPPKCFNYQAVVRDTAGKPLANKAVSLKVSFVQDSLGPTTYIEKHTATTNQLGLVNLKIGCGSPLFGSFSALEWGAHDYYIKLDIDLGGGDVLLGEKQVLAVPHALYAEKAGSSGDWVNVGDTIVHSPPNVNVGIGVNNPKHRLSVDETAAFGNRIFLGMNGTEGGGYSLVHFKNGTAQKGGLIRASIGNHDDPDAPMSYESSSHSFLGPLSIHNPWPSLTMKSTTSGKVLYWEMTAGGAYYLYDPEAKRYRIMLTSNGVGIGISDPKYTLDVAGSAQVHCLSITGGCDITEPFPNHKNETLALGSVVVIDEAHPGMIRLASTAYDTKVAGVISGAGGVNPGLSLSQAGVLDNGQQMALAGRVYVRASTCNGEVRPGDMLTTSDLPGLAMRASDRDRSHGAVLGKAMSGLKSGEGLVMVLVNLQ